MTGLYTKSTRISGPNSPWWRLNWPQKYIIEILFVAVDRAHHITLAAMYSLSLRRKKQFVIAQIWIMSSPNSVPRFSSLWLCFCFCIVLIRLNALIDSNLKNRWEHSNRIKLWWNIRFYSVQWWSYEILRTSMKNWFYEISICLFSFTHLPHLLLFSYLHVTAIVWFWKPYKVHNNMLWIDIECLELANELSNNDRLHRLGNIFST